MSLTSGKELQLFNIYFSFFLKCSETFSEFNLGNENNNILWFLYFKFTLSNLHIVIVIKFHFKKYQACQQNVRQIKRNSMSIHFHYMSTKLCFLWKLFSLVKISSVSVLYYTDDLLSVDQRTIKILLIHHLFFHCQF